MAEFISFGNCYTSYMSLSIGGEGGDDLIITIGEQSLTVADWNRGGGYKLNTFSFNDQVDRRHELAVTERKIEASGVSALKSFVWAAAGR
ncbi:MAG TPA: hypothetical protein VN521_08135 [Negativicutes bacterium]|nr:hypothetical protein [Negativicutes bacterium]